MVIFRDTRISNRKELEATVQLGSYDLITEAWWDELHNWSAALGGCKLFRRDRQGRAGGLLPFILKKGAEK